MKIPRTLFDNTMLSALKKDGIVFDFNKDYNDGEIVDYEEKIENAMLTHAFTKGVPTANCAFWEHILDTFTDNLDPMK